MNSKPVTRCLTLCASGLVVFALSACDSGSGGNTGGAGGSSSAGNPTTASGNPTTASGNPTTASGSPTTSSGGPGLSCPSNYCAFGDGGYVFGYADSQNMAPQKAGTSTATLAADGSLCISGNVMEATGTPPDFSDYWGCGIGINLNQTMGTMTAKNTYTLTGTGVTVGVNAVPTCTAVRVVLDQNGATPAYCADLTPGVEIPWSKFNTACWDGSGTALSGPPTSQAIKVQFVSNNMAACPFTNFCITDIKL
jgi:hypothetical protein